MMNRTALAGVFLLAATAGALALRAPGLDTRPMHTDEAVHACKFNRFLKGEYAYDPHDYHGPTLYYLTLPSWWMTSARAWSDTTEFTYRVVPVAIGTALVLLLLGLGTGLGRTAMVLAGVVTALSPAMVFYSRYYIQEMVLVFFTLGLLVSGWRYARTPGTGGAMACGTFAGLMYATKETSILTFTAMAAALGGVWFWRGSLDRPRGTHATLGFLTALLTAGVFLSGFGANLSGPLDSLRGYADFLHRGLGGEGLHNHPWTYYLEMLLFSRFGQGPIWSEALILGLAAIGLFAAVRTRYPGMWFLRFTALYTVVLTALYSALPYKTPWCMLSPLHGMILLAGVGAATLVQGPPHRVWKVTFGGVLAIACVHLGWQAYRSAFPYAADSRNPYVYAQTVPDTVRLGARVEALARLHPDGNDMRVNVMASGGDYWPLPWYLRTLNPDRIGYWSEVPPAPDAPVVIASASFAAALSDSLHHGYHASYFGLRPSVLLLCYVRQDLWDDFLRTARHTASTPAVHTSSHHAMATTFQVFIAGKKETYARQAAEEAFRILDRLEAHLSRFRPTSDVSRINAAPSGTPVRVSPAVLDCLTIAARIHGNTGGAFDVTLGPLMDCWGNTRMPTKSQLAAARNRTGMALLEMDGSELTVRPMMEGVKVDLGGIGKGFGLDRMAALLREWDIESALLHGGHSSVLAMGSAPGKQGWPVVLPDPEDRSRTLLTLHLENRALGASGLGRRSRHILDPRTGRPAFRYLAAWALAPEAAEADALSTAFMVMTPEAIRAHCRQNTGRSALVVTKNKGENRILRFGPW